MERAFNVVIEKDSEGFFVASVPALPGCHTQAKNLDELIVRTKEAILLCLEVAENRAQETSPDFIAVQKVIVEA